MILYLAGENYKTQIIKRLAACGGGQQVGNNNSIMQTLHLAGEHEVKNGSVCKSWKGINILESFFYARNNKYVPSLIGTASNFLLDSGAFTFMQKSHDGRIDWDRYIESYAAFINKYNVEHFFELDIDSLVGIREVERLRERLESLTGKKPIPVWHISRGKKYFIDMCRSYAYVAIGGIVTQEIPRRTYESAFHWFISTAHENKAKIHGLGYTSLKGLARYKFDSVDSASWLTGNRSGKLFMFNSLTGTMEEFHASNGARLKPRIGAIHNFEEWVKFARYIEKRY